MLACRPNGSRLTCGATASGHKHPAPRYELAGAQTDASLKAGPVSFKRLLDSPTWAEIKAKPTAPSAEGGLPAPATTTLTVVKPGGDDAPKRGPLRLLRRQSGHPAR